VALTAAAAGLFSSWVRPADSEPRASSRSRWLTAWLAALLPKNVNREREPFGHQLGEAARVQHEEAGRHRHPEAAVVVLRGPLAQVGLERAGVNPGIGRAVHLDVVAAHPAHQHQGAFEQDIETGGRVALGVDGTGLERLDPAFPAQPGQLVRGQLLEQEQRAQLIGLARLVGHHSFSR